MHRRYGTSPSRAGVAELAARLMAEEGIESYQLARRKAAGRLGVKGGRNLPDNSEIAALLSQYQRLFRTETQAEQLCRQRKTAVSAMRMLSEFNPRLVGSVLAGTAGEHSVVTLHVFADTPEEIGLRLSERAIPCRLGERRLRSSPRTVACYPTYSFVAGQVAVDLVVFGSRESHQAPLSPVDGKPMRRADRAAVEALIDEAAASLAGSSSP